MYGHFNDLQYKSVLFKVKVYKIADEMLIKTLVQELESCLIGTTAPEIFSLFDLYLFLRNQPGINRCKQVTCNLQNKFTIMC
jgi:hypothetical protein